MVWSIRYCLYDMVTSHWSLFDIIKDYWRHFITLPYLVPSWWFLLFLWHFMVIYHLIYPPIALKFVNSVLWKYQTPLKIPSFEETRRLLKESKNWENSERLTAGEATRKATPCASLQPCLRFWTSSQQAPFLWREKY